jgi:cytochrome P450
LSESLPDPLKSAEALHDPFDWYASQRRRAPVRYDSDRGVYDVFSYEHVRKALHDNDRLVRESLSDRGGPRTPFSYIDNAMVWSDGPRHGRTKGQLFDFFRPDLLADLRGSIRAMADSQLDAAVADGTEFDFVESFAVPVPLRVIMQMIGVPERDHQRILEWLKTFREVMYSEHSAVGSGDGTRMQDAVDYFERLVARRTADPRDDLISRLATETDLTDAEIGSNCFDFILAGQGTMSEFLSNAVYLFDEHALFDRLEEYDLEVVLEEVLRYRSSLQSRARRTAEPVMLGETEIPADETVILWIGAANRDPERYERSETFVPDRDPDHLAFGSGPHTCIGAPLARLEAPIILRTFVERFDEIEVHGDAATPKARASKLGFEELPVSVRTV